MWGTISSIIIFGAIFGAFWWLFRTKKEHQPGLPPGPWGLPVVGHLPFLGSNPTGKLMEWRIRYGPIFRIRMGAFPALVLNDATLIRQLFSRPELAGRPPLTFIKQASDSKGIVFSEGLHHRQQHKFAVTALRGSRRSIRVKMEEELALFLHGLRSREGKPVCANRLFDTSVINSLWSVFMGQRFEDGDPELQKFIQVIKTKLVKSDTLLSKLAMFLPTLDRVLGPYGSGGRVTAFKQVYSYMTEQLEKCRPTWQPNEPQNICHVYMDKVAETKDVDSTLLGNAQPYFFADIFMGAIETTTTTLSWLLHYLVEYPETQVKVQEEIDRVVGHCRLPQVADQPEMPYAQATLNELFRISSVAPLGLFHNVAQDMHFKTYRIPKDMMVISNIHAAHFDRETWGGDSEVFRPERWLQDGKIQSRMMEKLVAFSSGQRSCVGQSFARDSIFLYTVGLLQKFTFERVEGEENKPRPVFGLTVSPTNFKVIYRTRTNF